MKYKSKMSLNTQLSALQLGITNLKKAIKLHSLNADQSYEAECVCDDIKQIIFSMRDIRYKLSGYEYKPIRMSQYRVYTISEIRSRLDEYSKKEYITETIQHIYRDECIRLATVEQYLEIHPAKNAFRPSEFEKIVDDYIHAMITYNLPIVSLNEYKYICQRLKEKLEPQDEHNYKSVNTSIEDDELF